MDIGNYSFLNRAIRNWNQITAHAFEILLWKPKIFRKRVRKAITNGLKGTE
jgi:hypothetical protein